VISEKISKMMTDPQRIRRNDPGDPEISPVFAYHKLYSSPAQVEQIAHGCRTAGIGCVECKRILIGNVISRLAPIRERRLKLEGEIDKVKQIIADGAARARRESIITMELVRRAIGI
jgi:tryptophanyl-tRNA synthetase